MTRRTITDYDPELLSLFDRYVHGFLTRRQFFDRAAKFAVGGVTVAALVDSLSPNYAQAQQVAPDDARLIAAHVEYPSPQGAGTMRGYLVRPADASGAVPGVVVIHENRGLNPYVEDVARRVGTAGFAAFAPDALFPLGGYPGNDDDGRALQRERDRDEMVEDFIAAVGFLRNHEACNGTVGAVGFCFGGSMANTLAVRVPELSAAVPFYGGQPDAMDVPQIQAALMIHYGSLDERVNAGWPAYEAALRANSKTYTMHMYEGAAHGFHNDSTPRFDEAAAALAWERTIDFFNQTLR
ncbi:MAG: dienelactone hydrolase family protein [Vicinamibacterales bacterium]|jgi:carboxymethylenebutenolidase|nr:carboxymethylenebutenolidase [Acidobacteriota bacterium]MDP7295361.1 dienelactone hydrolase family protein [Vicinamibacterales bacterium]MDP7472100.1 dienelactone hydrolase family protein [Vicinamibacterales bacterium]MDP7673020.1 dienelactone hydrolase family protein [Vicinamibacterales bacterium]HJO37279.1 dienelactone hydrolase family protein [Vicinamibacterales bacterium]|tara:strand:- start:3203 stop:4090 length:888 start_codon:yes stop_codon:yes gene_type:complete